MDIIIALIPAIAWGSIGLVAALLGGDAKQQTLGMTVGALIIGIGSYFFFHPDVSGIGWLLGFLSGCFWFLGQKQYFVAMNGLGVSKAIPLSTGSQLLFNTLASVIFFHEWQTRDDFVFGSCALALLILGAALTAYKQKQGRNNDVHSSNSQSFKAYLPLVFSTFGFVMYSIIMRYGQVYHDLDSATMILPQSIGMVLSGIIFSKRSDYFAKGTLKNILTGCIWGLGNTCMILAMAKVGLATSFSLSQSGIVISTLGGIFILKEEKTRLENFLTILGCLSVIVGGILLGVIKA